MLQITGTLIDTARESGEFTPDGETSPRAYDYTAMHILEVRDGAAPVLHKVRLPKGVHVHGFGRGEDVTVSVEVPKGTRFTATLDALNLTPAKASA